MNDLIITDSKRLNKFVTDLIKTMASTRAKMHVAAVSCLHHAAEHGISDLKHPLNRFYNALTSNERQSFRQYLDRCFLVVGGIPVEQLNGDAAIPSEVLASARKAGTFLGYTKEKGFYVKTNTVTQREAFRELAVARLIEPDGVQWMRFFDRNNIDELKKFGNDQVITQIKGIVTRAIGDNDKVVSTVDRAIQEKLVKFLAEIGGDVIVLPPVDDTKPERVHVH